MSVPSFDQGHYPSPPADLLAGPDISGLVRWIRMERDRRVTQTASQEGERFELVLETLAQWIGPDDMTEPAIEIYMGKEHRWRPRLHPRLQSHRPFLGAILVWLKKRLVGPVVRWHVEFTEENARAQGESHRALWNVVTSLTDEVLALRHEIALLKGAASSPHSEKSESDS